MVFKNMPPAERLIDLCLGPARAQSIYLFTRLGLAEILAIRPTDYRILAQMVEVEASPLYRLLRALISLDVVAEIEEGHFALSAGGEPLVADNSASVRAHVLHMNEEMYAAWGHAMHTLKTGKSAFGDLFGEEYFDWLAAHPAKEAIAHRAMNDTQRSVNDAVVKAYDFSRAGKVCDVGGGHGALLSAILAHYPDLRGVLFDLDSGLKVAQKGVGGPLPRCEFISGDFFAEVPAGADIYLLKLVLHDWDDDSAVKILRNCRLAMHSESRLLVIEGLRKEWPETSVADLWDFHMLVNTGGKERSLSELCSLAKSAGLQSIDCRFVNELFSLVEFAGER